MSEPKFIQHLIDVAAELGAFVEKAQGELRPDEYRVVESTAYKALASLERGMAQLVFLTDQYHRMLGRRPPPPRSPNQLGIVYQFRPTKRRPSKGPGGRR